MSSHRRFSDSLEAYVLANHALWKTPLTRIDEVTNQLYFTVSEWLRHTMNSGAISGYNLRDVTPTNDMFFTAEVALGTKPGDAYVVDDQYEGLIISVKNGKERAIASVLKSAPSDPRDSRFRIDVEIHPVTSMEYVQIKLVV